MMFWHINLSGWGETSSLRASHSETAKGSARIMSSLCKLTNPEPGFLFPASTTQKAIFLSIQHLRARYQASWDPSYTPKLTAIIQTSQSCIIYSFSPCLSHRNPNRDWWRLPLLLSSPPDRYLLFPMDPCLAYNDPLSRINEYNTLMFFWASPASSLAAPNRPLAKRTQTIQPFLNAILWAIFFLLFFFFYF